ncbi:MAG: hypothetical protein AB2A00_40790 [Myxococcota bacterium]
MTRALVLLATGLLVGCPPSGTPGAGGSSSGSSTTDAAIPDAARDRDAATTRVDAAGLGCQVVGCGEGAFCVADGDAAACRAGCTPDAGECGPTETCHRLRGDGSPFACIPGGGVGQRCGPEPCRENLVCAAPVDAGATCRYPCDSQADAAGAACPAGYFCFPRADASQGACFPR